jgi:hypothetical protein
LGSNFKIPCCKIPCFFVTLNNVCIIVLQKPLQHKFYAEFYTLANQVNCPRKERAAPLQIDAAVKMLYVTSCQSITERLQIYLIIVVLRDRAVLIFFFKSSPAHNQSSVCCGLILFEPHIYIHTYLRPCTCTDDASCRSVISPVPCDDVKICKWVHDECNAYIDQQLIRKL